MPSAVYILSNQNDVDELVEQAFRRAVYRSPPHDREMLWRFMPLLFADIELLLFECWCLKHYGSIDEDVPLS